MDISVLATSVGTDLRVPLHARGSVRGCERRGCRGGGGAALSTLSQCRRGGKSGPTSLQPLTSAHRNPELRDTHRCSVLGDERSVRRAPTPPVSVSLAHPAAP
ncbi:unnamed protein product, partial [Iphiclides podalirius]